jgi:hypothetical protein
MARRSSGEAYAIIRAFAEIVAMEGPILCERLYALYVEASGDPGVGSVRRVLNRAAYAAVKNGVLAQVEPLGGGQADKTVYLPTAEPVVLRPRGPRVGQHIPASEVQYLAGVLRKDEPDIDEEDLLGSLLSFYELSGSDWWVARYIGAAVGIDVPFGWDDEGGSGQD